MFSLKRKRPGQSRPTQLFGRPSFDTVQARSETTVVDRPSTPEPVQDTVPVGLPVVNQPTVRKRQRKAKPSDEELGWSFVDDPPHQPVFDNAASGVTANIDENSTPFDVFSLFFLRIWSSSSNKKQINTQRP